jgi:hypothetical protein
MSKVEPILNIPELLKDKRTMAGISAILFATAIAPRIPNLLSSIVNNNIFKFLLLCGIAYVANDDLVLAVVFAISLFMVDQIISIKKVTSEVVDKTEELLYTSNETPSSSYESLPTMSMPTTVQTPTPMMSMPTTMPTTTSMMSMPEMPTFTPPVSIESPIVIQSEKIVTASQEVLVSSQDAMDATYNKIKNFIESVLANSSNVDVDELSNAIMKSDQSVTQDMINNILNELMPMYMSQESELISQMQEQASIERDNIVRSLEAFRNHN